MLQIINKFKGEPFRDIENFSKKSHKTEKREVSECRKKWKGETLLLWNGFLSHVRGFGCVQNEVLSTYGKSAYCTKSGPIALN